MTALVRSVRLYGVLVTRAGASAVLPNRQRASEDDSNGDLVVLVTWDGLRQKD